MPRPRTPRSHSRPSQLAKRWNIGVDRVRQLVIHGHLFGTFRIPSAGRYGDVVKIPLSTIRCVEREWAAGSITDNVRLTRRPTEGSATLPHLRELNDS